MTYRIVFLIESIRQDVYDLLTEKEFDAKDEDYWGTWNWLEGEVDLMALAEACRKRNISTQGRLSVIDEPYREFNNFIYII